MKPSTWVWYEKCNQIWDTTPKCTSLPGSQDRGEVPYTSTKNWFGSIWDIGFESGNSYKSGVHDANKPWSKGCGSPVVTGKISVEESLQITQCGG